LTPAPLTNAHELWALGYVWVRVWQGLAIRQSLNHFV
jgi:hypothetical protein